MIYVKYIVGAPSKLAVVGSISVTVGFEKFSNIEKVRLPQAAGSQDVFHFSSAVML